MIFYSKSMFEMDSVLHQTLTKVLCWKVSETRNFLNKLRQRQSSFFTLQIILPLSCLPTPEGRSLGSPWLVVLDVTRPCSALHPYSNLSCDNNLLDLFREVLARRELLTKQTNNPVGGELHHR